jgi:protein SCO1
MSAARRRLLASAAVAATLAVAGVAGWQLTAGISSFTSESWRRASVVARPRAVPSVVVEDESGTRFALNRLCGKVAVVDFIYTRCPTICKGLGSTSSQLAKRFRAQGLDATVLSISFDPDNDTPERLRAFKHSTESTASAWQLARPLGSDARQQLLATFGVVSIPDGFGGFDHNAALHIVDRQCRLVRILDTDDVAGAEAVVRALAEADGV